MTTPAISPAYIEYRLSGGASNSDPAASWGGIMSSTRIAGKTATGISNITGVSIEDAPGSTNGAGTLAFTASGQTLAWTPSGGTIGPSVAVDGGDGRYTLWGVNADLTAGYLFITVTVSSLPGTDQSDAITVANATNRTYPDVTKKQSFDGLVDYMAMYVHNAHPTDPFIGAKFYIGLNTSGPDDISIGLDPAGVGDGSMTGVATTIASAITAPAGVTFSQPANIGAALGGDHLNAGEARALWQKRVVPAGTTTSAPSDISTLVTNGGV